MSELLEILENNKKVIDSQWKTFSSGTSKVEFGPIHTLFGVVLVTITNLTMYPASKTYLLSGYFFGKNYYISFKRRLKINVGSNT